ncbi:shikimate dehydrogenase, partial [Pseudorhodobacter sp.]|uniref:shikimate dehydrogenase n=1 Tax=Pseudorhodobacter sp. TaxID=1934400 RepID=UPI002647580B
MTDRPRIPLAGVIGSPIAHSKSPALHGYWLRRYGINGHYIPMEIAHDDLAHALELLPRLGFVGLNVTLPHKEAVVGLADIVTDRAALIGAANTLIFRNDGKIYADNTDGSGFVENLRQYAPGWEPKAGPAMVFGAGGAARAIVAALIEVGVPEIRITNRTRTRAEALRADFGAKLTVVDWVQSQHLLDDVAAVVNTT